MKQETVMAKKSDYIALKRKATTLDRLLWYQGGLLFAFASFRLYNLFEYLFRVITLCKHYKAYTLLYNHSYNERKKLWKEEKVLWEEAMKIKD
jgi:hypothetical protein